MTEDGTGGKKRRTDILGAFPEQPVAIRHRFLQNTPPVLTE